MNKRLPTPPPLASYRIQLTPNFGFRQAEEILPYLKKLGVSHIYFSPYLSARPGTMHGYDISNHAEINTEMGSREDFDSLVKKMKELELAQIFDMVPNHMGILGNSNQWWNDVLENGPASVYADYFDIDWNFSIKPELNQKVLLPILGCSYGEALESGNISVKFHKGKFHIHYYDHVFPVSPCSIGPILTMVADRISIGSAAVPDQASAELCSVITAVRNLPRRDETSDFRKEERRREAAVIARRLDELEKSNSIVAVELNQALIIYNGTIGSPLSFNLLDSLLNAQSYRLSYFRVAADEINYRRFFDINDLAAVRVEVPKVFADIHKLLFELVQNGAVQAVRVDHIDGLYDPQKYLDQLWEGLSSRLPEGTLPYLLVEKILGVNEVLPDEWPVAGTTGYELLAEVGSLLIDNSNEKKFNQLYSKWSSGNQSYAEIAYRCKREIQDVALSAELHVLAQELDRLSECNRRSRDFTQTSLMTALREVIAFFPVYRSYASEGAVSERDKDYIGRAISNAMRRNPAVHQSIYDFLRSTLMLEVPPAANEAYRQSQLRFVRKFQQLTGPVMAKGVEDTAFYIYNRLIALNEVGNFPERFGMSLQQFHRRMEDRTRRYPTGLSTTSTHDTKRGEDTRARISALSELPVEFEDLLNRLEEINHPFITEIDGQEVPDRNISYLFYQTLVGIWPCNLEQDGLPEFRDRMQRYMEKATHEAKQFTSWVNPNTAYDNAIREFVEKVLSPTNAQLFEAVDDFSRRLRAIGYINSLSQLILKLTLPGVPDIYQGTELWDFNLVDPDNRRAVDYSIRSAILDQILELDERGTPGAIRNMLDQIDYGTIKLFALHRTLKLRQSLPNVFLQGDYTPLDTVGSAKGSLVAFLRTFDQNSILVAVARATASLFTEGQGFPLGNCWSDTYVELGSAQGVFINALTGQKIAPAQNIKAAELFSDLPFSILVKSAD